MRERLLMDFGWRFALGHAANPALDFEFARDRSLVKAGEGRGAAGHTFDDSKWRKIDLPHDFAIEQPLDPRGDKELAEHGFYSVGPDHPESSVGWYRKTFDVPESDLGRRIAVHFDGIYRDSVLWFNGHRMGRHASGYTPVHYDVTDLVNYGGPNVIAVRADASNYEGWFYEGAGIYRHAWLIKTAPLHVARDGTFVTSDLHDDGSATLTIRTTVANDSDDAAMFDLASDVEGTRVVDRLSLDAWTTREFTQALKVPSARLWSPDAPNLYTLKTTLTPTPAGSDPGDEYATTFGIRTFRWSATEGFFLNGKHLILKGTCNHRDYVGVGVAAPDRLQVSRIEKLKELGSNAFRASHYMVAPELLDACDRLGMLVLAENRSIGGSPDVLQQWRDQITRDRNHPSIFGWSLGNEEHTVQWSVAGERLGKTMTRIAHQLDPTRMVTNAMHDRGLNEGVAKVVDVHGWNYIKIGSIDDFHARRPDQPIFGSEEGSTVATRGIYADDAARGYVSAYDKRAPGWGQTAEKWWRFFCERPWLAGGFVWTGFDHRGEPIPYKWPCTLSHFGLMDLCGFPKDNYFYYQSWWSDRTVLHLFPHWNWTGKEGQAIDVRAFSNCDEVELIVNGESRGRRAMERNSHLQWDVLYTPGFIEAIGFKNGVEVARDRRETTDVAKTIELLPDRTTLNADGEDCVLVAVQVRDAKGLLVPTADDVVHFDVNGPAKVIGVGNGDPSSHESEQAPFRRLFNGLAMAVVQMQRGQPGAIQVTARSDKLKSATVTIHAEACALRPTV